MKIFGIPVNIHFTFLLVIPLIAWIIGSQIDPTVAILAGIFGVAIDPTLITSGWMPYILGTVVAIGLFAGVLIHELGHCIVARRGGIKIRNITLLIMGGVSSMEEDIPDPATELPMALAGPITSLGIGLVLCAFVYAIDAAYGTTPLSGIFIFLTGYLGILNLLLFAFNLLPAFPMDGGRVLRAFLAGRMPLQRATRIAAGIGQGFAVIFGLLGLLLFNPILIIIAFFIYIGAGQETQVLRYHVILRGLTVKDAMSSPAITVTPEMPLDEVIKMMYDTRHLGFPVVEKSRLVGIITLSDIHRAPPIDRDALLVQDVMTWSPIAVDPSHPLIDALRIMTRNDIGRIPVVAGDHLIGIITRTDILRLLEIEEGIRND
ncbi:MAG: CBS domain-containing protein [Methanoculleaceae archaeon]